MQTALFRLGAIVASAEFLATVPRPVMVQAIKRHATKERMIAERQPVLSCYFHGASGFFVLTDAERRSTRIRLDAEASRDALGTRRPACHLPAESPIA